MQATPPAYPRTAYLLSMIGGILILIFSVIYALLILALAGYVASFGFGFASGFLIALAVVALIFGVLVLFFAMRLKSNPGSARVYGVAILVLALISFFGGGGFYIGAILALVGGILAIIWTPPAPAYNPAMMGQPMGGAPGWGAPAPPPPPAPGQKTCTYCGAAVAPGAQFCAKCGAAVSP